MKMTKRPFEYRVRQIVTIVMFIAAIVVIFTGIILYTLPEGTKSTELGKGLLLDIHTYAGFIAAGMFPIHVYLNRRPLTRYFKEIFK